MKKNFLYAMMSAIALSGAVSFSACSSSEDVAEDVNPTYDGEAVKTQFTLSLPWDNSVKTRQTSDIVQEGATTNLTKFRGISGIKLIPFASATDRTTRLGANITLGVDKMRQPTGASNAENAIPNGKLLAGSNAVLYNDVTIPVGTSGFLFYGLATASSGGSDFTDGKLTATGLDNETSAISFKPTPIADNPDITVGTALATYVSSIAAASSDNGTPSNTSDDISNIWAKCANSANSGETWYSAGLGEMYTAFTQMKAGASSYVQAAVQDLYTSILNSTDLVSTAIKAAILNSDYASDAGTTGTLTFTEAIKGYPANIDMPEGAAALTWSTPATANDPKVATAVKNSNFGDESIGLNLIQMTDIVYPASLYYFVDSKIKTSNTSREADYEKTENNTWAAVLATYSTGDGSVTSATRSVAITDPIQYAVGRLDVTVNKLNETNYYDRKGVKITIPSEGYELTGVLIGGQKDVDYKFEQTGTKEYTIYDKTINSAQNYVTASANAATTYTMALQTGATQEVYVALEFLNKGEDFQGFDGVVKKNCKFYMIAKLNPSEGTKPSEYSGGVFKQDFKTIANFTFGAGAADLNTTGSDGIPNGVSDNPGGFANAYVTIPDLRTPKLELGLSVNLKWEEGITFNVTF